MLVLTRKVDEQILIGDDIKITLIRVRGNAVRIGIEAPRSVRVVRGELGKRDVEAASKVEVELELDGELDDLAAVFAHPESQVRAKKASKSRTNRISEVKVAGQKPQIFVGSVSRSGENPKIGRAPLASFVSAS